MDGNLHIGEAIRRGRRAKKISQKELAKILEVSPSLVSFWENSMRGSSGQELIRVARYLNIVHLLFPDYEICEKNKNTEDQNSFLQKEISQYRQENIEIKNELRHLQKKVDILLLNQNI